MLGYFRLLLAVGVLLAHAALTSDGVSRAMVGAFFVVSGYLIAMTWAENYRGSLARRLAAYYRNRALRVYPLHVAVSGVVLLVLASGLAWRPMPDPEVVVRSLLLLPEQAGQLNGPAWTLPYELGFYLVAPALSLLRWRWAAFLLPALPAGVLIAQGRGGILVSPFGQHGEPVLVAAFLFGVGYALHRVRLPASRVVQVMCVATLAGGLLWGTRFVFQTDMQAFDTAWSRYFAGGLIAVTAALLLTWNRDESRASRLAGDLCYPVYMLHWPVIQTWQQIPALAEAQRAITRATGVSGVDYFVQAGAVVAISLALSLGWLAVERATIRRLRAPHTARAESPSAAFSPAT